MPETQNSKSFSHFAKHLFLISRVYVGRENAKKDVGSHLQNMKKAIIRMSLTYSDIDRLKEKVDRLVDFERKYAKLLKPEDKETQELKNQLSYLEEELRHEKETKQRIIYENEEKMQQLTESLSNIKSHMRHLLMEKAKRQHRLRALEGKINENVDVHGYYRS